MAVGFVLLAGLVSTCLALGKSGFVVVVLIVVLLMWFFVFFLASAIASANCQAAAVGWVAVPGGAADRREWQTVRYWMWGRRRAGSEVSLHFFGRTWRFSGRPQNVLHRRTFIYLFFSPPFLQFFKRLLNGLTAGKSWCCLGGRKSTSKCGKKCEKMCKMFVFSRSTRISTCFCKWNINWPWYWRSKWKKDFDAWKIGNENVANLTGPPRL